MLIRTGVFSAAAMLLLLAGVQAQHRVTLSSKSLCAVTGSTIQIPCTFTKPYYSVTQREWYRVQSSEGEPQDLSTDPQYSGRVSVNMWGSDCRLTVRSVRVSDSGVYNFRFKTQRSDWISTSSGVHLTVTDLKVIVSDSVWGKKLSCITTCTRSNKVYWYENEQRVPNQNKNYLFVYVYGWERDSYSCGVTEDENFRSTAVCAGCWSVTYSTQTICSLIGSSVDMHSYYTFPHYQKVTNVLWFIKDQADGEPVDITEEEEYQGRVQYTRSSQNNCGLKITNLTERDAQTYRFRFYTDDPKAKYTGEPGVSLSVTDLKVIVSDGSNWQKKLRCSTTCNLPNNHHYIWYKNGQRVTKQNRNDLDVSSGDAGSYSCAVGGHEDLRSPAVYSPKNTRAVLLPSGDTVEGDSVTLSCSSDANPPVLTYTWFKQRAAGDTLLTTGQDYSISNISSQHSGLYYCTAHNQLGQQTSTPTLLDVLYSPKNTRAVLLPSGDTVEGDSVTLSCSSDANPPVLNYTWFRAAADTLLTTGQNYSISNISFQHRGLYYCTAHNQLGQQNSTSIYLDVLYPPRNLSMAVIPSVSGDFVMLLCSSDSNPTSFYTWYRITERDVVLIGNGTNLTLSSEEAGFHYCMARNRFGSARSSEWPYTSDNRALKCAISGVTVALVLILLAVYLWKRRGLPASRSRNGGKSSINNSTPIYDNISGMAMSPVRSHAASSEEQDNVQYTTAFFKCSHTKEVPLYSTAQLPMVIKETEDVEYATVNIPKPRAVGQDDIYRNFKVS